MLNQLYASGVGICLVNNPDLYIYVVHGQNTYDDDHFAKCIFDEHTGKLEGDRVESVRQKLGLTPNA